MGTRKAIVAVLACSSSLMSIACDTEDPVTSTDTDATSSPDVADTTTSAPDTTPDTSVPDTAPVTCGALEITGELVASDAPGAFTLGGGVDLGFGGSLPDAVVLEFYTNATGTFDLGSGDNRNYATCDQCVRIVQDIDGTGGAQPKHFFQKGGRIIIAPTTPPEDGRLEVVIEDLELIEVKIFADYHTEPVANGACYQAEAPIALETGVCTPVCGDRVCGADGCGGECGAGCESGEQCALDGASCDTEPGCHPMTLRGGELDHLAAGVYRLDTTSKGLGAQDEEDFLQLEFYSRNTGTFDLAEVPNDDYSTCKQCVRMVLDGKREFFQAGGTLVVETGSDPLGDPDAKPAGGALTARLVGIRLVEVTYDEETFETTPIPNGACVDMIVDEPVERTPPPE